jgi:hypothetical protein
MKIIVTNKFVKSVFKLHFVILLLGFKSSYSQIFFRNQPKKYYESLINNLNNPDSLYVYEISSSWGSGVAYFISFKKNTAKTGYYFSNNFLYKMLAPRKLMPSDSFNLIFRIEYNNVCYKKINKTIGNLKIFELPNDYNIKDTCLKDFISDGGDYQLSKITKDTFVHKSYYEIYEYARLCPHIKEYQKFIELDKLFQNYFNKSKDISHNIISEYRKRQGK